MVKYIKISAVIFLLLSLGAAECGEGGRRRKGRGKRPAASLPAKGTKVAFIFPAGAGAMRVSLGIYEALEKEVGPLHSIVDVAGGVSSGALAAAGLTHGNPPKNTATTLKADLGPMLKAVFPHINELADKLVNDHGFKLGEMEAIFTEMGDNASIPLDFSPGNAVNTFLAIITNAAKKIGRPSIATKIKSLAPNDIVLPEIVTIVTNLSTVDRGALLAREIKAILGPATVDDPEYKKVIAIASNDNKPVFFASPTLAKFLPGPYAVGSTPIEDGLVATAAIPQIITAPININFIKPDGTGPTPITPLVDGFFAVGRRFDPSELFYKIFTDQFAGQDLLIIYVGNGAKTDQNFRRKTLDMSGGVAQKEVNGKKITYVAIDATIKDGNNDLFNLSGFYANDDLFAIMDKAAKKATEKSAFKWTVKALKSIMQ